MHAADGTFNAAALETPNAVWLFEPVRSLGTTYLGGRCVYQFRHRGGIFYIVCDLNEVMPSTFENYFPNEESFWLLP